ncbi:AF4/FMR2 family member 4 [Merluccius polli]|uniref:AF4/FMR2 family member 4 n=1 Tax=Merluccius polli TaxID=89951 RepID=A0AA47PBX0_MERPO|nr:AF4/FMR2 family member 4 [Merluccius polli]
MPTRFTNTSHRVYILWLFFQNCKPSLDASLSSSRSTDTRPPDPTWHLRPSGPPAAARVLAPTIAVAVEEEGGGRRRRGHTVSIPKIIHHVAFSYVNITTLFVSAHDVWEKADVLAHKSSGVLSELNTHMSPLSLSSSMKSMVRYTRQALHWLRLDQSIK